MRVIIIGAGGHAQVVADILLRMAETGENISPAAFLDDNLALKGQEILGIPVLGETAVLPAIPHEAVIIAIGDNQKRRQLYRALKAGGEQFATACHPTAVIAPDVNIGPGSMICANAVVNTGSVIGVNVILNTGCTVDHHNQIGDHVHIAPGVNLGGNVHVGEGAFVGIGAAVMPQCQIGHRSRVGAGAVVIKSLPERVTAVGVPARIIKKSLELEQ